MVTGDTLYRAMGMELKLTDAGLRMPLMPKKAANRSDKSKMRRGVLPACRKGRFGVKAVDKQAACRYVGPHRSV